MGWSNRTRPWIGGHFSVWRAGRDPKEGLIGSAADRSLACGSKPPDAADDEREREAQQQHERAEDKEALAYTPAIGDAAHDRRDRDRGQSLAGLTQAYDRALLMAAYCPRLHRQDERLDHPFQPAADELGQQ